MSHLVALVHRIAAQKQPPLPSVAALAGLQHGVVARWQVLELGLGRHQIANQLRDGALHPIYRGVYAVGHRKLSRKGWWMAAVLAVGPDAVLSHRAATALWALRPAPSGPIDVTDPGRTRHRRKGIRVHSVRGLHPGDCRHIENIPVTNLGRTLIDYAEVARFQQLRHAVDAADRRDLLTLQALTAAMDRASHRSGPRTLQRAIDAMGGKRAPWTQSELERRFLALIREAGLPEPQTNVYVAGELVDNYWPEQRLVVEVDAFGTHRSRGRFESDRRLDAKVQRAGCRVLRASEERIEDPRLGLLEDVETLLSAGPADAAA